MYSIKIRTKRLDGNTQIRILIAHPMAYSDNQNKQIGETVPAHYIKELVVKHNGTVVVTSNMAGGVAKDPYFAFMLRGGEVGDELTVSWVDNLGKTDTENAKIS
jgi:sulfur-oxidizing protein SoxZ